MSAIKKKKSKRGGKRKGSGRANKYGEPTVTIAVRVPKSKAKELKEGLEFKLKEYEIVFKIPED